jgi:hypothetical protein
MSNRTHGKTKAWRRNKNDRDHSGVGRKGPHFNPYAARNPSLLLLSMFGGFLQRHEREQQLKLALATGGPTRMAHAIHSLLGFLRLPRWARGAAT